MLQIHQDRAGALAAPISGTIFEGRVARVHPDDDPLRYPWGNEARDAAGLQEICDQLQVTRPFCLLHPDDLIANGARADVVGQVIGARVDGDHVVARILVTDQRALDAIRDGMHELSLGYTSRLDAAGCQRDIRVDHLALVPRARCGASCALRADCAGACACNNHARRYTTVTQGDLETMDELTKKLTEALAEAAAQRARADALDAQLAPLRENLTKAEVAATNARAELATQKTASDAALAVERAKVDAAETAAKAAVEKSKLDAAADLSKAVKARVLLETQANRILGTQNADGTAIDRSGMSAREIQLAVISHVDAVTLPTDKPDAFYEGVFEGAVSRAKNAAASVSATREAVSGPANKQDGIPFVPLAPGRLVATGPEAEKAARQDMADRKRAGRT